MLVRTQSQSQFDHEQNYSWELAAICALTTMAQFAYPFWETIVIPVGNVIVCKQGRTHYNHLKEEEEENEEE